MMEAILNVAWVLLSFLAIGAGIAHHRARRHHGHSMFLAVVALATVALLVFPVISLTDDLHPAIFASEAGSKRDMASALSHAASSAPALPSFGAAILLEPRSADSAILVKDLEVTGSQPGFAVKVPDRGPPRVV